MAEIINELSRLKAGDHLCAIYKNEEEHRALLIPFIRKGFEHNEKVIYIADENNSAKIIDYLIAEGLDPELLQAKGQLVFLTSRETYLKNGAFDPESMIKLLENETAKALAEGYSLLRVTGEMSWALGGLNEFSRLIEYEKHLNHFFSANKTLAICQYDRRSFKADFLLEVLRTHPLVVFGDRVYENFYYMPPEKMEKEEISSYYLDQWEKNLIAHKLAYHSRMFKDAVTDFRVIFIQYFNNISSGKASRHL